MEIRALQERDDRSAFRSGNADLDRFLHLFAGQSQFRHHVGVTYVAVQDERILGYATVAPGHVEIDALPVSRRKQLPRYPLPVLRLARLAVDESARGTGLGTQLLRFVLLLARRTADTLGCIGVLVDAKPGATDFYLRYGFVPIRALEGRSDARPQPQEVFLGMAAIVAAIGSDAPE